MLIYLIIAAELAILYTVFWYVYVRDPKPYKISGNLWGKYGDKGFTAGGADPTLPFAVETEQEMMRWWRQAQSEGNPDNMEAKIARSNALRYRRMMHRRYPLKHEHYAQPDANAPQEQALISRVLGMFSRTLDALSVKHPT